MIKPPNEILKALAGAEKILIATHIYPDGDALGSQLALGMILESLGKKVVLYGEEKVGHLYDFMPCCHKMTTDLPNPQAFDCVVAVDCADLLRLGTAGDRFNQISPFVMIDHHAGHKPFGDMQWVDPERASTGEMIYDLAVAMNAEISREAAFCLYTAVVSDTGSFKYSSTSADTFRVAGDLISRGVNPAEVAGRLFDNFTFNRLQLLKKVLDSLEMHCRDKVAIISATREMFAETGTVPADTENFINYPRSLASVQVAAFIKAGREGVISVSLRSKGKDFDVARLASTFGGGGHRNAAGFKVRDTDILAVKKKLLAELDLLGGE